MNVTIANLQRQREEVRARLLDDEEIRGRIAFRAYEIYQHRGNGYGSAFEDWLQAEGEIVSSLVEQALQLSSASTGRKALKGNLSESPKPRVKPWKKSQSRAASVSGAASRKAKTEQAASTGAKTVKGEMKTGAAAKKPSGASVKKKERSSPETKV